MRRSKPTQDNPSSGEDNPSSEDDEQEETLRSDDDSEDENEVEDDDPTSSSDDDDDGGPPRKKQRQTNEEDADDGLINAKKFKTTMLNALLKTSQCRPLVAGPVPQNPQTSIQFKDGTEIKFPMRENELAKIRGGNNNALLHWNPEDFTIVNTKWDEMLPPVVEQLGIVSPCRMKLDKFIIVQANEELTLRNEGVKLSLGCSSSSQLITQIGMLVIQLPSKCSGGRIVIFSPSSGESEDINFAEAEEEQEFRTFYAAFYTDRESHLQLHLTSGICSYLLYKLERIEPIAVQELNHSPMLKAMFIEKMPTFKYLFKQWNDNVQDSKLPDKLVFLLSHQDKVKVSKYKYHPNPESTTFLKLESLPDEDKALIMTLEKLSHDNNFTILLGRLFHRTIYRLAVNNSSSNRTKISVIKLSILTDDDGDFEEFARKYKTLKFSVNTSEIIPNAKFENNFQPVIVLFPKEKFLCNWVKTKGLRYGVAAERYFMEKCSQLQLSPAANNSAELKTRLLKTAQFMKHSVGERRELGPKKLMAFFTALTKVQDKGHLSLFFSGYARPILENTDIMLAPILELCNVSIFGTNFIYGELLKIYGDSFEDSFKVFDTIMKMEESNAERFNILREFAKVVLKQMSRAQPSGHMDEANQLLDHLITLKDPSLLVQLLTACPSMVNILLAKFKSSDSYLGCNFVSEHLYKILEGMTMSKSNTTICVEALFTIMEKYNLDVEKPGGGGTQENVNEGCRKFAGILVEKIRENFGNFRQEEILKFFNTLVMFKDSDLLSEFCTTFSSPNSSMLVHIKELLPKMMNVMLDKDKIDLSWNFISQQLFKFFKAMVDIPNRASTLLDAIMNNAEYSILSTVDNVEKMTTWRELADILLSNMLQRQSTNSFDSYVRGNDDYLSKQEHQILLFKSVIACKDSALISKFFAIFESSLADPDLINLFNNILPLLMSSFKNKDIERDPLSEQLVKIMKIMPDSKNGLFLLEKIIELETNSTGNNADDDKIFIFRSCHELAKIVQASFEEEAEELFDYYSKRTAADNKEIGWLTRFCKVSKKIDFNIETFFKSRPPLIQIGVLEKLAGEVDNKLEEPWLTMASKKDFVKALKTFITQAVKGPAWTKRTDYKHCGDAQGCADCSKIQKFMLSSRITETLQGHPTRIKHIQGQLPPKSATLSVIVKGKTLDITKIPGSQKNKESQAAYEEQMRRHGLAQKYFDKLNSILSRSGIIEEEEKPVIIKKEEEEDETEEEGNNAMDVDVSTDIKVKAEDIKVKVEDIKVKTEDIKVKSDVSNLDLD